ncbi:MAG: ribbon-helix-helix domain-containing protein [Methanosarcinaceae archaeon]|nr:ribbon-helix-helix domain-containing protein [Methanosarcinaceae archaeon]
MTTNVVQLRMPPALLNDIENLVMKGYYKNKSEVIIDALRHFIGTKNAKNDVAQYLHEEMRGMHLKREYSTKEIDLLWDKVRSGNEWKERFGSDVDSVMSSLRGRQ